MLYLLEGTHNPMQSISSQQGCYSYVDGTKQRYNEINECAF